MTYKTWFITLAIVGATTSFAVHALSADKGDGVFIDEGDGDFDSMPIPPQGAATASKPSQSATTASQKPAKPTKKSKEEKIADVLKDVPTAPGPAPVVAPAPAAETQADQIAAQATVEAAPDTPEKPLTIPDEKPVDAATQSKVDAEVGVQLATKGEVEVPTGEPTPAPKKGKKKSGTKKTDKVASGGEKSGGGPASFPKDPGLYVTTREACPMKREPASESALMITVKPSKKIWVQKVEEGKWYRAFNKAGEPGYIEGECVTPQ